MAPPLLCATPRVDFLQWQGALCVEECFFEIGFELLNVEGLPHKTDWDFAYQFGLLTAWLSPSLAASTLQVAPQRLRSAQEMLWLLIEGTVSDAQFRLYSVEFV